jgi:hypothetical protein
LAFVHNSATENAWIIHRLVPIPEEHRDLDEGICELEPFEERKYERNLHMHLESFGQSWHFDYKGPGWLGSRQGSRVKEPKQTEYPLQHRNVTTAKAICLLYKGDPRRRRLL